MKRVELGGVMVAAAFISAGMCWSFDTGPRTLIGSAIVLGAGLALLVEDARAWYHRGRRAGSLWERMANQLLRRFGLLIVPAPNSAKMLREHANVSECHHPSHGGNTVEWMREVADLLDARSAKINNDG